MRPASFQNPLAVSGHPYDRTRYPLNDRLHGRRVDVPHRGRVAATPRLRHGHSVETGRGGAAAATWTLRGDGGDAASATWTLRGAGSRRRRGCDAAAMPPRKRRRARDDLPQALRRTRTRRREPVRRVLLGGARAAQHVSRGAARRRGRRVRPTARRAPGTGRRAPLHRGGAPRGADVRARAAAGRGTTTDARGARGGLARQQTHEPPETLRRRRRRLQSSPRGAGAADGSPRWTPRGWSSDASLRRRGSSFDGSRRRRARIVRGRVVAAPRTDRPRTRRGDAAAAT